MTDVKLQIANQLSKEIEDLKRIIICCKQQQCEWIEFTFGNGSNKSTVCDDKWIIKKVRDLLIEENTKKLDKLVEQFLNL